MNFFETVAGHTFANHTIPELVNQIEGLNYNLTHSSNKKIYTKNVVIRNIYDPNVDNELNKELEELDVVDVKVSALGGGTVLYTILHKY